MEHFGMTEAGMNIMFTLGSIAGVIIALMLILVGYLKARQAIEQRIKAKINMARAQSFADGKGAGFSDGVAVGFANGKSIGITEGRSIGRQEGYEQCQFDSTIEAIEKFVKDH
jgi:hypothetical protein